jgi:integrase
MQRGETMPRERKQKLKKRPDGRYACRYHNQWFYSYDHDDCLRQRDEYKQAEKRGRIASYFVTEYANNWLSRTYPNANRRTIEGVKRHVKTLQNAIGDLPVSDVKPSDIKGIYSAHYVGLSNSYIRAAKQVYCAMFDSAVADGLILSNPARDRTAKPHKGTVGGHRSITAQERQWILTLCTNHRAFPAAMTMLYAGLRPQEAKALRIDRDVDFKKETITVRQTAHTDPDNWQKYALTDEGKTERSNRTIPLLPPLKAALEGRTGLLITSTKGEQVTRTIWSFVWQSYKRQMERAINGIDRNWYGRTREHKAILAAGGKLPPWIEFTITPYDLRHSFATMCRDMHPPIELHTVIKWMGHSDATMILHIYDAVTDDRDESEAQRLRESMTTDLTTDLTTKQ